MEEIDFLDASLRQASIASDASRRPWPLPAEPWVEAMTYDPALLLHWAVPAERLARQIPREFALDLFDGNAWLSLVAANVVNARLRGLPPLPGLSSFLQVELRTYVTFSGRGGIWPFSVQLTRRLLVELVKRTHRLPAYLARLSLRPQGDALALEVTADGGSLRGAFEPCGPEYQPQAQTLEHFLLERYALFTADGGRLYRAELQHSPWRLRPARGALEVTTLLPVQVEEAPRASLAARQDVLVWGLVEL